MFTEIDVEKTGRQMVVHSDAMAAERLKIPNQANYNIEVIHNKAQGMRDAIQGASDGARRVDRGQVLVNEIEISGIDGT
jgi:hypothetical protein